MITKISKPFKSGKVVYDNKGSVARLVNYLAHEAKPLGQEVVYFNQTRSDITPQQVVDGIDANKKGLRSADAKFYSLVISPSAEELQHIGSDPEKLKSYTRQAMENYAQNFKLKDGKTLSGSDLVWYATFHQGREYNGLDEQVRKGKIKTGEAKPGLQTHVHVVVSRRDVSQQVSLSPTGRKERFSIQDWQKQNAQRFQQLFSYEKQTYFDKSETKEMHLRNRLEKLSTKTHLEPAYLQADRVVQLAKEQQFSWKFYRNLRALECTLKQGIRPTNPYEPLAESSRKAIIVNQSAQQAIISNHQPIIKADQPKQLLSANETKAGKQKSLSEKQPDLAERLASRQTGQLAQFFNTLARNATIAGNEDDWNERHRKQKPPKRQPDTGLSR